jgi:2-dehydro-3-deoxygalactonokinase
MGVKESARLIGLDWGSSSLRAYLFGEAGRKLAENSTPSGVMHLERLFAPGQHPMTRNELFEAAFEEVCADWLRRTPGLPVIACGMVGSTVGWKEAAYVRTPAGPNALAGALTQVSRADGSLIHIVPGILAPGVSGKRLPEIMRGEETQISGIFSGSRSTNAADAGNFLVGLPGTHSKWVQTGMGKIVSFTTFVTGELYGLLTSHSVIAKTERKSQEFSEEAFQAGMEIGRGQDSEGAGGVLSTIFSTRTKSVLGELRKGQQSDYLSGLLIAEELAGVERVLRRDGCKLEEFPRIVLAGEPDLCARYKFASNHLHWPAVEIVADAAERGLWRLARTAQLIT